MLADVRRFDDAQQHAASLLGWNQVYDQLTAGRFDSALFRLDTDHIDVFREVLNQRVVQHGQSPANRVHFSIPLSTNNLPSLQGCQVSVDSIMALRGGEEFVMHMPAHGDSI